MNPPLTLTIPRAQAVAQLRTWAQDLKAAETRQGTRPVPTNRRG